MDSTSLAKVIAKVSDQLRGPHLIAQSIFQENLQSAQLETVKKPPHQANTRATVGLRQQIGANC